MGILRRVALTPDGEDIVTRPVSPAVQRTIERALEVAHDALCAELAPFGLHPLDIAVPTFEQVVYEDEAPVYARIVRARMREKGTSA